jgi:hypothetical protein
MIDIAKEIYRNSTMEKLALLQMLKQHEIARRDTESSVEARLSDRIEVRVWHGLRDHQQTDTTAPLQTLRDILSHINNAGIRLDGQLVQQETNMNAGMERLDESVKLAVALKDDFWLDVQSRWEAILDHLQGGLNAVIKETGETSLNEMNIELRHALSAVSWPHPCQKGTLSLNSFLLQHGLSLREQEAAHGLILATHASKLEEQSLRAYDIEVARMVSIHTVINLGDD